MKKARFGRKVGGEVAGFERKLRPDWQKKQDLAVKLVGSRWGAPRNAPFKRKLRPDWQKKHVLAVKEEGTRWVREKITARLVKKASFGRKIGGEVAGFPPGSPHSRENYGQISEKSKIWP